MISNNICKIHVNNEYTWEELCQVLGIDCPTGGNSKIARYAEIEQYMKLKKSGNTIEVIEIYAEPAIKEKKLYTTKYSSNIELILLHTLQQDNPIGDRSIGVTTISDKHMNIILGLCDSNLYEPNKLKFFKKKYPTVIENEEQEAAYNEYLNTFFYKIREVRMSAQRTLTSRKFIVWNRPNYVRTAISNPIKEVRASLEQEVIIMEAERLTRKELGYNSNQAIYNAGKWFKYKELARNILIEIQDDYGIVDKITYYEKVNEIGYTKESLEAGIIHCSKHSKNTINSNIMEDLLKLTTKYLKMDREERANYEEAVKEQQQSNSEILWYFDSRKKHQILDSRCEHLIEPMLIEYISILNAKTLEEYKQQQKEYKKQQEQHKYDALL